MSTMIKPERTALIADYLEAQSHALEAANRLQDELGLTDDDTDEKNGWTLTMWLHQAPLFSRHNVEEILKKFSK